ncbi:MAG: PaaI family thioesterase [Planctomycetes bacterium]|nr:PaaI family thioesterase [Planctomycetota bacterium]
MATLKDLLGTDDTGIFTGSLGMENWEFGDGEASCTFEATPAKHSRLGILHGGVVSSVLDTVMAVAAYTQIEKKMRITTLNFNVVFFKGIREGAVKCSGKLVRRSRRYLYLEAEAMTMDEEKLIAKSTATFLVSDPEWNPSE